MIKYEHDSERLIMEKVNFYVVDSSDTIVIIKNRFKDNEGQPITSHEMYELFDKCKTYAVETKDGIYTNLDLSEGCHDELSVSEALNMVCEEAIKSAESMADSLKNVLKQMK